MKFNILLLLGLIFSAGILNAQTDFRPGYVITVSNDTIHGQIDYRGDLLMGEICRFRNNDKEDVQSYYPVDIVAFRFNDSKYFVSKEINGTMVFLEFLIKGQINIYYLRDYNGDHYFLEKADYPIIELPYEEGIKYVGNKKVYFETNKHIGLLNYYMQDAPEFQSRIANIGEPEHESLIKLAKDYHNKVCKDGACVIYEKKLPMLKFNFEIIGGIAKYQNTYFNNDINYFQAGILTHFWMPRTSEKLYLRTGILHSTVEVNNVNKTIYKIPFQFEYIYPKGIVRPIVAFGINIYSPFYQSVALTGGVNIQLYKCLYWGLNYDIDFNPNEHLLLLPKSFFSQSISTGFIVKI